MNKSTTVILKDSEMPFKDLCIMFEAVFAWVEGIKYRLPEEWKEKKK